MAAAGWFCCAACVLCVLCVYVCRLVGLCVQVRVYVCGGVW
jgi:hypothetical protein